MVQQFFMLQRLVLALAMLCYLMPTSTLAAKDDGSFKEDVRDTVSDTVNASKDFFSGVIEGLTGPKAESPTFSSSQIVTNKTTLVRLLKVQVTQATDNKNGSWILTVAFRNSKDFQIKVTNMSTLGQVAVLDGDGFAYPLPNAEKQGSDFIVLPRAAAKVRFTFSGLENRPVTFRLLGADFPVPN